MQTSFPLRQTTPPWLAGAVRLVARLALVFAVLVAAPSPGAAAAPDGAGPDFEAIDRYVEAQRRAQRVPGMALAVVQDGEVVHLRGFGAAGPSGHPVTPQTPFLIGSLTKSVTALAVMQLVEAGRLELDAPVQRYLPWFRVADEDASARITLRHLLYQTSGLPAGAGDAGIAAGDAGDGALEREVRALRSVALAGPVGATHRYSNANYVVLGLMVQTAAGQSYEAYVQERILRPLGMRRSYTSKAEARAHGLASGHRYWFGVPVASDLPYPRGVLPAGYLIASAEDMARYLAFIQRGGQGGERGEAAVLSPAGVAELVRPGAAAGGPEAFYAMGWGVVQDGDLRVIGHAGETFDFRATMGFVPERGLGMVLLMNADTALGRGRLTGIADGVYDLLLGREPAAPAATAPATGLYALLVGIVLVQGAGMGRSLVALRRWPARPERRPRGRSGIGRHVALPLATNLAWAALTLLLLPRLLGGSLALMTLQLPDVAALLLVSGAVALAWAALRTALAVRALRRSGPRPRPPAAAAARRPTRRPAWGSPAGVGR